MEILEALIVDFSNWLWGTPLLLLLLGGGLYFLCYSNFIPFKYFRHGLDVLRGKYDDPDDPGQINHYQALSTALAATVGMGNISGVAVAITTGGPGAIFWMWVSAVIGMATKFFTCTLSIMYRGKDEQGEVQGGPMYVITEGLGEKWRPLAMFFSIAGLIGMLPIFQANQFTQILGDVLLVPNGIETSFDTNLITGLIITLLVSMVIFGGIKRIGKVAGSMVPMMVVLYFISVFYIVLANFDAVPESFTLIFQDAFTGDAVLGGALGAIIIAGARRAAFSNEAGIGTAPMAHGAAKTVEPVREGLVAMLGPFIDTIVVCTLTALAILITGAWQDSESNGVTVTVNAFDKAIPGFGIYILVICVTIFATTSLFSYSYYGTKCLSFIAGVKYKKLYNYFYVGTIVFGATASLTAIISLIDASYALMSIPTMVSAILLSPQVKKEAKKYFRKLEEEQRQTLERRRSLETSERRRF